MTIDAMTVRSQASTPDGRCLERIEVPDPLDPGSRFRFGTIARSASFRLHSTVTLLARLRGLSISQPRRRAT